MRTLLIHAGGKSERIKKSIPGVIHKSWLEIAGKPIILRNIMELYDYVSEIIIIVKNQVMKDFFQKKFITNLEFQKIKKKVSIVIDDIKKFPNDQGPIISIKTGVLKARNDVIVSIPSDIPFLNKELFILMEKYLSDNTIVSIQSQQYFNSLIFIAKKTNISNLAGLNWIRVTDLYRLFPNSIFVQMAETYSKLFLGINTKDDYESAILLSKNLPTNIRVESEEQVRTLRRNFSIKDENLSKISERHLGNLFQEKCYYLLITICLTNKLTTSYKYQDLLKSELELWKPINEIIYSHCEKDYKKSLE